MFNVKRVFAVVLALMIICLSASAEEYLGSFDFENMTDEELELAVQIGEAVAQHARDEIDKREQTALPHYSNSFAEYTVKPYFMKGFELLLEFRWKNIYNDSRTFKNSVTCSAYQNGKELPEGLLLFDPESHRFDIVSQGDTATAYVCFRLQDMSDVSIFLSAPKSTAVDTFMISLSGLETYKSRYE